MNEHKKTEAWHKGIGPGGMGCPCCHHNRCTKKETKKNINRRLRRKMKKIDID